MDWLQAVVPPAILTAVVLWAMRDLKVDLRDLRADLRVLSSKIDKLRDDHGGLATEVAELRGSLRPIIATPDQGK